MSSVYEIGIHSTDTSADGRTKTWTMSWLIKKFRDLRVVEEDISELRTNKADYADGADEDTKFLFKMAFLGKSKRSAEIYYLAPAPMFLKYTLSIWNNDTANNDYSMVQPNKWQHIVQIDNIKSNNYLYKDGKLSLYFRFTINKEIKLDPSYYRPKAELICDLETLLNNSIYSDVTIKSVEGVEFQSHKLVLAIRSPVLKAHFEHNTVESVTNVIDTPYETEVLKEVLRYIYTDNTLKVDEMPEKLLAASDYYQLSRLKQLCEEALFEKLTIDNAIETLELADLHSATKLKKMTLDFIHDGNVRLIMKTKGWTELQSAALIKAIFEYI